MTQFKALSLIQSRNYVIEKYGEAGSARLEAALSDATRRVVYSEHLVPTDWVELEHCIEHALAIDRVFGTGDGMIGSAVVREITRHHFGVLYRSVLAGTTPRELLVKSSRLWSRYYDRGETSVEFPDDTSAIKRIIDCPDLPLHHEIFLVPYYEELLKLCGASEASARHVKCVATGAPACVTEIRWRMRSERMSQPTRT